MGTDFIWGVLPKNVQELNQSYDLFKKVITDFGKIISGFRRFWRFRKKAKMKKAVLGIRAHVGVIDSIFSTLRAKMRIALDRNDRTGFKMHQDEICQIYSRVTDTSHELLQALSVCERYLDGYPKLKDALHLKLESEGVDDYGDESGPCDDLDAFAWWVNVAGDYTRKALDLLNEHLEYEY